VSFLRTLWSFCGADVGHITESSGRARPHLERQACQSAGTDDLGALDSRRWCLEPGISHPRVWRPSEDCGSY
jgi:hypothetical protein